MHGYVDLLSDRDLTALAKLSGHGPANGDAPGWFRAAPERIEAALGTTATTDALFGLDEAAPTPVPLPLDAITPLLVFAAVIHRSADDITDATHVPERIGGGLVVPVFDGGRLADFVAAGANRLFLVELLGSYTRVMSGPRWERSRGRWRRRRFSEMNPAQLARLAADLPAEERAGAYRRLGDLALFLNGVFADHSVRQTLAPIDLERIVGSVPRHHPGRSGVVQRLQSDRVDSVGAVLGALGPLWYQLAADLVPLPAMRHQLGHMAEHFDQARRFLTFTTDRWLFPQRDRLFPTI
ncbi:MAG: hypothetical protein AAGK32_05170 [Actinomycetota bacterium]